MGLPTANPELNRVQGKQPKWIVGNGLKPFLPMYLVKKSSRCIALVRDLPITEINMLMDDQV